MTPGITGITVPICKKSTLAPLTTISLSGDIGGKTNEVKYTSNQQHANWDWGQQVGNNPQPLTRGRPIWNLPGLQKDHGRT